MSSWSEDDNLFDSVPALDFSFAGQSEISNEKSASGYTENLSSSEWVDNGAQVTTVTEEHCLNITQAVDSHDGQKRCLPSERL